MKHYIIFTLFAVGLISCTTQAPQKPTQAISLTGYWEYLEYHTGEWSKYHFLEDGSYHAMIAKNQRTFVHTGKWTLKNKTLTLKVEDSQNEDYIPVGEMMEYETIHWASNYILVGYNEEEHLLKPTPATDTTQITAAVEHWNMYKDVFPLRESPESVVRAFFTALSQGDYEKAKLMATDVTKDVLEQVKNINEGKAKEFDVKQVSCITEGDYATCDLCCDAKGKKKTNIAVVKEVDGWAVKMESKEQFEKEEANLYDGIELGEAIIADSLSNNED